MGSRGLTEDASSDSGPLPASIQRLNRSLARLLEAGMITGEQISARLGVSRTTLGRLRTQGRIQARICNDQGQWLYWPPNLAPPLTDSSCESTHVSSTAGGAV